MVDLIKASAYLQIVDFLGECSTSLISCNETSPSDFQFIDRLDALGFIIHPHPSWQKEWFLKWLDDAIMYKRLTPENLELSFETYWNASWVDGTFSSYVERWLKQDPVFSRAKVALIYKISLAHRLDPKLEGTVAMEYSRWLILDHLNKQGNATLLYSSDQSAFSLEAIDAVFSSNSSVDSPMIIIIQDDSSIMEPIYVFLEKETYRHTQLEIGRLESGKIYQLASFSNYACSVSDKTLFLWVPSAMQDYAFYINIARIGVDINVGDRLHFDRFRLQIWGV